MIYQILSLFIYLAAGCLAGYSKLAKSADYKPLTNLVFYIFLPASILIGFSELNLSQVDYFMIPLLVATIATTVAISLLIFKILKLDSEFRDILIISSFFGNIVYFGFPFVETFIGPQALATSALYVVVYNIIVFVLLLPVMMIRTLKDGKDEIGIKKIVTNPVILITIIGLIAELAQFDISPILPYLKVLGALTTPLSLIAMGLFFSDKTKIYISKEVITTTFVKCIVFPLVTLFALLATGKIDAGKDLLLLSIMPIAVTNFVIVDFVSPRYSRTLFDSIAATTVVSAIIMGILIALKVF